MSILPYQARPRQHRNHCRECGIQSTTTTCRTCKAWLNVYRNIIDARRALAEVRR